MTTYIHKIDVDRLKAGLVTTVGTIMGDLLSKLPDPDGTQSTTPAVILKQTTGDLGATPDYPYCSIRLITSADPYFILNREVEEVDKGGGIIMPTHHIDVHCQLFVNIEFHGENSAKLAQNFRMRLATNPARDLFKADPMFCYLKDIGDFREVFDKLDTSYTTYFSNVTEFYFVDRVSIEDPYGTLNSMEYEYTLYHELSDPNPLVGTRTVDLTPPPTP